MHLSAAAVRRPVATTMLLLAAVLLGLVSLPRLEISLLPEARSGTLLVWIAYRGAAVAEVEEAVARPAEEALLGVPGVRSVRTRVVNGGASFRVALHPHTDPDVAALGLRERLDGVRWSFPEAVERPLVLGGAGEDTPFQVLALAADDRVAAADWAETVLRPRLEQIDGVARAQVIGVPQPEVRITPDLDRLRVTGHGVAEIGAALKSANVDAPGGTVRRLGLRYALQVESRLVTATDVADVVIAPPGGPPVRVGDVAVVTDGYADPVGFVRLDGREAVGLLLYRAAGANLLTAARDVRAELARIRDEFPDLDVAIVADSSPFVRQSVTGVWQSVWLGGLLAFGVLFLFLRDARSPLFLVAALPVSVITTFAALDLLGTSLNLMSLGGIALGVGMLVDNGIVCLENIHRLRAGGLAPAEAAVRGAREIAMPILASTLTTCAVFVPLAFVPGAVGALFRDQALAVSVSLLVSWVVALALLPMLYARFPGPVHANVRRPLYGAYHRALQWGLRYPALLLSGAAVAIVAGGIVVARAPRELLPDVATDHLEVRLHLPPGRDATATDAASRRLETWLAARGDVLSVFAAVGDVGALDPGDEARRAHYATLRAVLGPGGAARREALRSGLRAFAAADPELVLEIVPDAPELSAILNGGQASLTCEVSGADDERAEAIAAELVERAGVRGLRLVASEREPQLRFTPREDALWRYGLTESDAVPALQALGSGYEATRLRRFDEEVPVVIRMPGNPDPAEANVLVAGRTYPVDDLFAVVTELAPATRWREDQSRVASIRWDGPLRDAGAVQAALARASAAAELPSGYAVKFGGAWRELGETSSALARAFALSVGLVLLILAAQFESVRLPVLIFAAVPMALPGVAIAVLASGGVLSVLSGVALVVLIGMVVNDAILKVDLLRRFRAEGVPLREAIERASRRRYRPIVMTTLTTAIALAPLFFGRGAELRAPLAATLIGGLVSSTILTLLVIPVLFERMAGGRAADTP